MLQSSLAVLDKTHRPLDLLRAHHYDLWPAVARDVEHIIALTRLLGEAVRHYESALLLQQELGDLRNALVSIPCQHFLSLCSQAAHSSARLASASRSSTARRSDPLIVYDQVPGAGHMALIFVQPASGFQMDSAGMVVIALIRDESMVLPEAIAHGKVFGRRPSARVAPGREQGPQLPPRTTHCRYQAGCG